MAAHVPLDEHPRIPCTLKKPSRELPPRSDVIHASRIPSHMDTRAYYLTRKASRTVPPPLISVSEFVPRRLVEHLMRRKKDSALGVKFEPRNQHRPDEITDMEGALHTFVNPVIAKCEMSGDYRWNPAGGGHGVTTFGDIVVGTGDNAQKVKLIRTVVLSASIHMDFELTLVMLRVCRLDREACHGADLLKVGDWSVLGVKDKQDDQKRARYDDQLRRHLVFHLTHHSMLPARDSVHEVMTYKQGLSFLELLICSGADIHRRLIGKFARLRNDHVVSLELLYNTALHQVRNEFSALELLCPSGYVYTYDPASIFARELGAEMINRLMLTGLRTLADTSVFANLRVFAFNDYADHDIIPLVSKALIHQKHVEIVRKIDLFRGPYGRYDVSHLEKAIGAMLVIHNNSDAYGQNIATESSSGSLDGAIGCNSSSAASLAREREDLLDNMI